MIKFVRNGLDLYINPTHVESVQFGDNYCDICTLSGEHYMIYPMDEGYADFVKILDGLTIKIVSALNPLAHKNFGMPR